MCLKSPAWVCRSGFWVSDIKLYGAKQERRFAKKRLKSEDEPVVFIASPKSALSSVVEHIVHTDGVVGSNPAVRTIS